MKCFGNLTSCFAIVAVAVIFAGQRDSTLARHGASRATSENEISDILYELKVLPGEAATELHVSLEFKSTGNSIVAGLPIDRGFGYRNSAKFVASLEGKGRTVVTRREDDPNKITIDAGGDQSFRLSYKLAVDPEEVADASFAPNAGAGHFHAFFSQWMLDLGNRDEECTWTVRWLDVPENWQVYISPAKDASEFRITTTPARLERAAVGAIRGELHRFETRGKPVSVYVSEDIEMESGQIGKSVEKIVRLERQLFDDFSTPFFRIVILPRPANVAGVAIDKMFVCFVKPDISQLQLDMLLAHEMLHTWITGSRIGIGPPEKRAENFVRNQWFIEGVTEYLSRKILLDAGLISEQQFITLFNQDVIDSANNRYGNYPFDKLFADANAGKWGAEMAKLGYYRGALLAFRWECLLAEADSKQSVFDIVAELFHLAKKSEGNRLTAEQFFSTFEKYGLLAQQDVASCVLDGETPELPQRPFVTDSKLTRVKVPLFDPGFDLRKSRSSGMVTGVRPAGPAYAAGLRNEMVLVRVENGSRFSRAWERDMPLGVVVSKDGKEHTISWHPTGQLVELLLYR